MPTAAANVPQNDVAESGEASRPPPPAIAPPPPDARDAFKEDWEAVAEAAAAVDVTAADV